MKFAPSLALLLLLCGHAVAKEYATTACACYDNDGCDQTLCEAPQCFAGNCNQTGTNNPTCWSTDCIQDDANNPTCLGGDCSQKNSLHPSCEGSHCDQDGSTNPTCLGSQCSQIDVKGKSKCTYGCPHHHVENVVQESRYLRG